jgi:hypothetical protein
MAILSFCPWARFNAPISTSYFTLIPFDFRNPSAVLSPAEDGDVRGILGNYFNRSNQTVRYATVFKLNSKNLVTDNLTDLEINDVFVSSDFLGIAGLSTRTFFSHNYWNKANLNVVVQRFVSGQYTPSVTSRRRCVPLVSGYSTGVFREVAPHHVSLNNPISIDQALLDSLSKYFNPAFQSVDWSRYLESIQLFNSSNTDDSNVSEYSELINTCSSFERLLNCRNGNERQLRASFVAALSQVPTSSTLSWGKSNQSLSSLPLREAFITDLFRLRGNLAHGSINPGYPSVWTIKELLLLSSFIFPTVLKSALESDGLYLMSRKDKEDAWIFDHLLAEPDLYLYNQTQGTHAWNNALSNGRWSCIGVTF